MKLLFFFTAIFFITNLNYNYCQIVMERAGDLDTNVNVFMYDLPAEIDSLSSQFYNDGTFEIKDSSTATKDTILGYLNLDTQTSFLLSRVSPSMFKENVTFSFFQQYYDSLEVDGGGYTIQHDTTTGQLIHFSPHIYSNINITTTPTYTESQLNSNFSNDTLLSFDLLITPRFGDFKLVWVCNIYKNDSLKIYFINAHSGVLLETVEGIAFIDAETFTYGTQNLKDLTVNNTTTMEGPNNTEKNSLILYENISRSEFMDLGLEFDEWPSAKIPSTTNPEWGTDAHVLSRELFYTADLVIDAFKSHLGIEFGHVRLSTTPGVYNARVHPKSKLDSCACLFGERFNIPLSTFDIVAHELAHCFLFKFLDYNDDERNKTVHEGIADIFSQYIEWYMPGPENGNRPDNETDWILGGDQTLLADWLDRDLSNQVCLDDIENSEEDNRPHRRGLVIGHWFYSIVNGIIVDDIPALGMETAIKILIEALSSLNNKNASIKILARRTRIYTRQNFGTCSPEFRAVVNAWDRVCVSVIHSTCRCDLYNPAELDESLVYNDCPELFVDLNNYYTGSIATNTILIWSTSSDSKSEPFPIVDPIVSLPQTTTYYAYFYNTVENCYSEPSTGIEVIIESCCTDTEDVYISGIVNYDNPMPIGGNIYIRDQGILTISSFLEIGNDKGIFVDGGGKLIIEGPDAILTVCNSSTDHWNGISLEPGSELITRGGQILNAKNGIYAQIGQSSQPQPLIDIQGIEIIGNSLPNSTGISLYGVTALKLSKIFIEGYTYGLILHNGSDLQLVSESEFKNIGFAGISSTATNFIVNNCKFENTGIGVATSQNNYTRIHGSTFLELSTGIRTWYSKNTYISNNNIDLRTVPGSIGIFMMNSSHSKIYNNPNIQVLQNGIWQINSPNTIIANNFISKESLPDPSAIGGAISLTNSVKSTIKDNNIFTVKGFFGIESNNSRRIGIYGNNLQNQIVYSGIDILGSMEVRMQSNSLKGTHMLFLDGINLSNSPGNEIRCNIIEDFQFGLNVGHNSEYQDILGNVFHNNEDLTIRSEIGVQPFHGNLFKGGIARAIGLNIHQIENSQFLVNSDHDYHLPNDPGPWDDIWFLDEDESEFYECPDGTNIPDPELWTPFSNDSLDLCQYYQHLKVLDTLKPNKFFLGVYDLWYLSESRQDFSLPACILSDPDFQNLCGLQEMAAVKLDLEQLGQHEIATDSLISFQQQWLETTDTTVQAQLESLIAGELDSLDDDFKTFRVQDSLLLSSIESDLDSINCGSVLVSTWKGIYQKYLSFLHTGEVDSADYPTLRQYSSLCSDIYGKPIHLARAVTATFDTTYYAQYDDCLQGMEQRVIREQTIETNIKVWPNPTTASVQIEMPDNYSGEMIITDLLGRRLKTFKIENGSLDFVKMPDKNGMYLMNFFSLDGQYEQHKIIVAK